MKRVVLIITLALLSASVANAGQIFGSLKEDGRSLNNVKFEVVCKTGTYYGVTDNYGAYSINVGRGKCTFRLFYKNQVPYFELYSYDRELRYDFDVVYENGLYVLRRK